MTCLVESKDDLKELEDFADLTAIFQYIWGTRIYPDVGINIDYEHD